MDGATLPAGRGELKVGSRGMLVLVVGGERGEWVLERDGDRKRGEEE